MAAGSDVSSRHAHLAKLLSFLEDDPANPRLLADTCEAAVEAGEPEAALGLIARYEALEPVTPALRNLGGLAWLQLDSFAEAAAIFEKLLREAPDDGTLKFNLAWALAMAGDDARAVEVLDDETTEKFPRAGILKVQALHRLGDLDGAMRLGTHLLAAGSGDAALSGAMALVAIDLRRPELARAWADLSGETPDALSVLGTLSLQDHRVDEAIRQFDRGLRIRPDSPRNLLGKGLALLAAGDVAEATGYLDRSARVFGTHLGTWIAAGWAQFMNGDPRRARRIFEQARALDDTFAESHGALAVLDIVDGNLEQARRGTEVALRLDRQSLAGALARSLLLELDGNPDAARTLRDVALNTPLASGHTISQAMVAFAPGWTGPRAKAGR
ncbi:MAG: tetratricopeptide repeat protein [Asticcacaulis sp.]